MQLITGSITYGESQIAQPQARACPDAQWSRRTGAAFPEPRQRRAPGLHPAPGLPPSRRRRANAEVGAALKRLITFNLSGQNRGSNSELQTMADKTKVVVRGGGENLYEVSESSGWFYAYKVSGLVFSSRTSIGKAKSFDQALDIIKSHSGRGIKKVE
jgi:hypothetical protein